MPLFTVRKDLVVPGWACPDLMDRDFLNFFMDVRAFKVHRGLIIQSAVESFWIIKGFDVVEDGQMSGTMSRELKLVE